MPAPPTGRDRRARSATYAVFFVQGLCFAALLARVPAIQHKFALSDNELSLVLLAVPVIAGAGSVLAGALSPRFGSAWLLRVAQPAVCLTIIAIGVVPNLLLLFAAVALFGLSVGAVDATMNMQAVTAEVTYGRSLLTGFHAIWSCAGLLGALWESLAAHEGYPLVAAFAIPAGIGIAISIGAGRLLFRADVEAAPRAGAGTAAGAAKAIPWRPIVIIGIAVTCMYIGDSATSSWSAVYLHSSLGATQSVAALAYGFYQGAMVIGRSGGDLMVRRYGATAVVRIGGAIAVLGLLGVVTAQGAVMAIGAFAVAGLGLCVVVPQSFSAVGKLDPAGTGVAVARVNLFNYVGFILGAAIIGPISSASSMRIAFAVPMVLALVIIALAGGFQPRIPDREPVPAP